MNSVGMRALRRQIIKVGARIFDRQLEDEANWLGPALLISEKAAMVIAERDQPHALAYMSAFGPVPNV
jgi:hypothetical protein